MKTKLLFSVFLSAVLLYTRPEFFLTFMLTAVTYLIYIFKTRGSKEYKGIVKDLLLVILITVLITFFNPVSRHRANIAFAQHYAMSSQERERGGNKNPDELKKPEEIMQEDFSTEYSMAEAFVNNPKLFIEHIWFNALRHNEHIQDAFPFFVIIEEYKSLQTFFYFLCLTLLILLFYLFVERIRRKNFNKKNILYVFYVLPPLISVLIFYPRVHYIIFLLAFILIYLSREISTGIKNYGFTVKYSLPVVVIFGILMIIFIPFRTGSGSIHESNCTALKTVFEIKNLKAKGRINFLSADPIIPAYVERDWNFIPDEKIESPVANFIKDNNINLILVDKILLSRPVFRNDNSLNKILSDSDFVKLTIPGCNSYLIAKKNVLE